LLLRLDLLGLHLDLGRHLNLLRLAVKSMKQRGCNSALLNKLSTDVASSFAPGARNPMAVLRAASRSRTVMLAASR
jgi:hypothetical protein